MNQTFVTSRIPLAAILWVWAGWFSPASAQSLLDREWPSNVVLENAQAFTLPKIGACQGVALLNHKLYFYGDRYDVTPRRGEIHEYTLEMKPTGRRLILNRNGEPLLTHPTGIAYLDKDHVFLGNTVNQQARIYLLDWDQAWEDGNLDRAIRQSITDDLAVNGCRPITVAAFGKRFVATADYGDQNNQVRLYDPTKLAAADRTSEPGVLVHRFDIGPFNQNLDWHAETGRLVGIQNVVAGLGWRLQFIDLDQAVKLKSGTDDQALAGEWVFPAHTELEGFRVLPDGQYLLVTAHRENNVWIGKPKKIATQLSQPGRKVPFFNEE